MHRACGAHDRPSNLIRHPIRNSAGVIGRRNDVFSVGSLHHEACVDSLLAVVLATGPAFLAVAADVPKRLHASY
jgi:hypothetical protein